MALKGRPDIRYLTTDEMDEDQFEKFRKFWIAGQAFDYEVEGISHGVAMLTAKNDFEIERRENGFKGRNQSVVRNREIRAKSITERYGYGG